MQRTNNSTPIRSQPKYSLTLITTSRQSRHRHGVMDGHYSYDALESAQHTRVLALLPSEDVDAALECSIDQVNIDDPMKEYEAISYTWGDQDRTERLVCDGAIINITPNLASALRCLRYRTRPRRLWADAVCINQEDLAEKGKQIPLMARIFRSATQVRVWLGNGDGGESRALHDLASLQSSSLNHPLAHKNHMNHHHPFETKNYTSCYEEEALTAIGRRAKSLLMMPWFGRRWVVQELVLNGNIMFHCGKSQISWQALHFAFHYLPSHIWDNELDTQILWRLGQLRDLWKIWCYANDSPMDCGIYSLLRSFHDLQCKEPKDRIYAIAGLADDVELKDPSLNTPLATSGKASIAPDYRASDDEVLQDLAFKLIRHGKAFETLAHAGAYRTLEAGRSLPSWVPDVRQPGSWPLAGTEREDDFEKSEVCDLSGGILTLNIRIYSWISRDGKASLVSELPFVQAVFEAENISGRSGLQSFMHGLREWLVALQASSESHQHRLTKQFLFPGSVFILVWSLIRSQLLAVNDGKSLALLPPADKWESMYRRGQRVLLEDLWLRHLLRALSTRTIYRGMSLAHTKTGIIACDFIGFGPRDLAFRDVILAVSGETQRAPVLFLRPEGHEHKVVGEGLVWIQGLSGISRSLDQVVHWLPRQVEIRLI